ncbi:MULTISPECIES: hypothetical protein [Pseudomonas]|uniref:hypothetical protein n=1 Tax=Pseudomonas TaxID=286 RepID=UPI001F2773B7|nr:hypothetical protein [Pseudomonas monteilii]
MARSHPLIEARRLEYEFEKVFRGLEERRKEPEYAQDIEFFKRLEDLRVKYGYSYVEVADLLLRRYAGSIDMLLSGVAAVNTRAVKELVDIYTQPDEDCGSGDTTLKPKSDQHSMCSAVEHIES